jgi:hypothetical protein
VKVAESRNMSSAITCLNGLTSGKTACYSFRNTPSIRCLATSRFSAGKDWEDCRDFIVEKRPHDARTDILPYT